MILLARQAPGTHVPQPPIPSLKQLFMQSLDIGLSIYFIMTASPLCHEKSLCTAHSGRFSNRVVGIGAMLASPFTLLKQTVNVLVVDDMSVSWSRIKGLLDIFGIYSVHIAESTRAALEILNASDRRFHACLLDRGMSDVERNEFFLLDKFGKTIPFFIVTARDYSEETFECGRKGALAHIRKDSPTFNYSLVSALNKHALLNIVCPRYNDREQSLLCNSVDMMVTNHPQQVRTGQVTLTYTKANFGRSG
jgi:CheY-like chemotaxis protein